MKNLIFATHSNPDLVNSLIKKGDFVLGKSEIKKFADQEISVLIKENVQGKNVYVLGSSFPPADNLLELLILIHTLKVNGAKKIIAIMPYFAYAKADHIDPKGASLSAQLVAQMIELAGASSVIVVNLHSEKAKNFFTIPVVHKDAVPVLAQYFKKKNIQDVVIVSPDKGGVDRVKMFARELGVREIAVLEKFRPGFDQVKILKIKGEVKNKNVIIVDDMIQSGGTILKAAKFLKQQGAKNIYVAVVHLVSTGPCVSLLEKDSNIKEVVTTNTIPVTKLPKKFKVVKIEKDFFGL